MKSSIFFTYLWFWNSWLKYMQNNKSLTAFILMGEGFIIEKKNKNKPSLC